MTNNEINYFPSGADPHKLIITKVHNAIIEVNQDLSILSLKWDPFPEIENFKAGWLLAVEMIKEFQIRRILHYATNLSYLSIESYNWMLKVIIPQLVEHKVWKVSRIVAPEPMAALVSGKYLDRIHDACQNSPCKTEFFTDEDTALYWLNS
jgi:hypothetical protein